MGAISPMGAISRMITVNLVHTEYIRVRTYELGILYMYYNELRVRVCSPGMLSSFLQISIFVLPVLCKGGNGVVCGTAVSLSGGHTYEVQIK